jgi:hypothetical protein
MLDENEFIKTEREFVGRLRKYLPELFGEIFGTMYKTPVFEKLLRQENSITSAYDYDLRGSKENPIDKMGFTQTYVFSGIQNLISMRQFDFENNIAKVSDTQKEMILYLMSESDQKLFKQLDGEWSIVRRLK